MNQQYVYEQGWLLSKENQRKVSKARENVCEQVAVGFCFACDW